MFGRAWCLPDGGGVVRRLPRVEPSRSFTRAGCNLRAYTSPGYGLEVGDGANRWAGRRPATGGAAAGAAGGVGRHVRRLAGGLRGHTGTPPPAEGSPRAPPARRRG